jgi:cytochrome c553
MKIYFRHNALLLVTAATALLLSSCEKKYFAGKPVPPPPKTGAATSALEAAYVNTPPMTLTDAYWKTADYLKVPVAELNKGAVYGDGYLNMTNSYYGLTSFNNGTDPKLTMKAAYDNNKLYLYVEWTDNDINPAFAASILDGPADPLKADSATRWTSQGNSDKMAIAFDISGASSSAGTFADKGCAASCHGGKMQTASGSVDIWSWDLATSDALGYAGDRVTDATNGLSNDAGGSMYSQNKKTTGNPRSGPAYEWDGTEQAVTRPDGKTVNLDPGYFLVNKTEFLGDYAKGKEIFHSATGGDCKHCHGENGVNGEATSFASIGFARKYSRASLKSFAASELHEGSTYYARVPAASVNDLIAYIKGLGSVPGTYLTTPNGSHADVWSVSNVSRTRINTTTAHTTYSVLLIRNLNTGNADDAQFSTPEGKFYPFGVALMNGDGKNHIGSLKQTLTFKPKAI